ncbi:hypothetical protein HHI36_003590 [Cryptolaemus montrouzieri]|uniref:Chemosensory protein n=1 Tax=Cryptolaemus montrouzieri TaxID=559131 RepID=A0ABD2PE38_9CUCU
MKIAVAVVLVFFVTGIIGDDFYTSKYDNLDVEGILKNDRLLLSYHKCLLEGIRCTPEGEELRKVLPEAIETKCAKCTNKHKGTVKKVGKFLLNEKPELWNELMEKYDPQNKYRADLERRLKE